MCGNMSQNFSTSRRLATRQLWRKTCPRSPGHPQGQPTWWSCERRGGRLLERRISRSMSRKWGNSNFMLRQPDQTKRVGKRYPSPLRSNRESCCPNKSTKVEQRLGSRAVVRDKDVPVTSRRRCCCGLARTKFVTKDIKAACVETREGESTGQQKALLEDPQTLRTWERVGLASLGAGFPAAIFGSESTKLLLDRAIPD